ncbi:hypothetical protein Ahy_A09g042761 [Arachis hypogaea]|uniref:Uncharacterized protein n=1 Tax=Arachis hypogaea TaxID=3818 RepID=A0A445BGS1_ARAHY|nr:hypothetical protein Ahy_A09g042761 [Arachis hypogaea]
MVSEESFVVLVHHRGSIKRKTRSGVKFTNKDPFSIFIRPMTSYDDFVNSILQKLGLQGVKQLGGSNRNTHTIGTVASSSSRPVGASSSVPVNEPPDEHVTSSSFAVDLNCSEGGDDIIPQFASMERTSRPVACLAAVACSRCIAGAAHTMHRYQIRLYDMSVKKAVIE